MRGGGSTELGLGRGRDLHYRASYPIGAVRLLDQVRPADPPSLEDWKRCAELIERWVTGRLLPEWAARIHPAGGGCPLLIGASGTATILAKMLKGHDGYDRVVIDGTEVPADRMRELREVLWGLPQAERCHLRGLPSERADVMLTGSAIYEATLRHLGFAALRVSTRSLRFGTLLSP